MKTITILLATAATLLLSNCAATQPCATCGTGATAPMKACCKAAAAKGMKCDKCASMKMDGMAKKRHNMKAM